MRRKSFYDGERELTMSDYPYKFDAKIVKCDAAEHRGFCHRVDSAKLPETRERRVDEVFDLLMEQIK